MGNRRRKRILDKSIQIKVPRSIFNDAIYYKKTTGKCQIDFFRDLKLTDEYYKAKQKITKKKKNGNTR